MTNTRIKFIEETEYMQFESKTSFKANYFYGSVIWEINEIGGFEFPSILQDETFYLQEMTIDNATQNTTFTTVLTLDDTYKNTGYFESYVNAVKLATGFYRIIAGSYKTSNLFEIKDFEITKISNFTLTDSSGDSFVDISGDTFTGKI